MPDVARAGEDVQRAAPPERPPDRFGRRAAAGTVLLLGGESDGLPQLSATSPAVKLRAIGGVPRCPAADLREPPELRPALRLVDRPVGQAERGPRRRREVAGER